mmetsp:Transcript_306/g.544  ORF Transcript_306/g.544 Transcript_306/m.544 type:complete len:97 (+) Transcript_306:946-1236(+)
MQPFDQRQVPICCRTVHCQLCLKEGGPFHQGQPICVTLQYFFPWRKKEYFHGSAVRVPSFLGIIVQYGGSLTRCHVEYVMPWSRAFDGRKKEEALS